MQDKIEQIFLFFQERCLWQFHSRAWDREANINITCDDLLKLLTGSRIELVTPEDRCHYSDSRILSDQIKKRFPWILTISDEERRTVIEGARDKLMEVAVTNSRNGELNVENY